MIYFFMFIKFFLNKRNIAEIPAMVQHIFFYIIKQRDHKYATPPHWKPIYVFLATAPTGVLIAGT